MRCKRCNKELSADYKFCPYCAQKIQPSKRTKKQRGNGQGCVYKLPNGKWRAEITLGYTTDENGKRKRVTKTKSDFKTKTAALTYIPQLKSDNIRVDEHIKFNDLYNEWLELHERKVSKSTMNCYKSAYKYYENLYFCEFGQLKTEHFQKCIDECPHGCRTKQNMKALGTLLCKYAMSKDIINKNYASLAYISDKQQTERNAFTAAEIKTITKKADKIPDLKYILVLIYTGLRLGEFINAKTADYNAKENFFVAGSKTKAGKDRTIPISPKIQPYFKDFGKGEYLFFGDKKMTEKQFRAIFYNALSACGIDCGTVENRKYTPHSTRHTFATLMKNVNAPDTDKLKLIGHSKIDMTAHYTHTDLDSLKKIVNAL